MVKHAPRHAKVRLAVPTHASLYGTPTRHAFWDLYGFANLKEADLVPGISPLTVS